MKHAFFALAAAILLAGGAATAHDKEDPRHIAMEALGKDMKAIAAVANGEADSGAETLAAASRIAETSEKLLALFPEGSGGHGSRAKPEIWTDWAGFTQRNDEFRAAAGTLRTTVASGDAFAIGDALAATGKTCKGCHQSYRLPKK
jgi:cytochrome c556